ncbi:MAG TPA: hypothetical protein PK093_12655 [Phycisphaerae bacterium]|nr:hypothetical protein [Phycisphaerae bacterium]
MTANDVIGAPIHDDRLQVSVGFDAELQAIVNGVAGFQIDARVVWRWVQILDLGFRQFHCCVLLRAHRWRTVSSIPMRAGMLAFPFRVRVQISLGPCADFLRILGAAVEPTGT